MKKAYFVLSVILFILYALVDFVKNVIEAHLHVQLISGAVNFAESVYLIDAQRCQTILLILGIVCLTMFAISFLFKKSDNQ